MNASEGNFLFDQSQFHIIWNTLYMQDALEEVRTGGQEVRQEDVERLSPLTLQHINLQGTYHLTLPESVAQGNHRPLRRPARDEEPREDARS